VRTARCTINNQVYTAEVFAQVEDFYNKRRNLSCTECNGPAFFRGATRNGREACFGARHVNGCNLATLEHDGTATGQGNGEDEIFTTGQRIFVDFNFGAPEAVVDGQPTGGVTEAGDQRVCNGGGTVPRDVMNRRLRPILNTLIQSEEFRLSTQTIVVPGQDGEYTATGLFRNFTVVTQQHFGMFHGYWGQITAARKLGNSYWFNTGSLESVSILLDEMYFDEVARRFNIQDLEDLPGSYLLVFGRLMRSQNGKIYVQITDPSRFTMRLA
jgi:hypothetical protein